MVTVARATRLLSYWVSMSVSGSGSENSVPCFFSGSSSEDDSTKHHDGRLVSVPRHRNRQKTLCTNQLSAVLYSLPSLVHPAAVLSFTRSPCCSSFLHSFTLLQYFPPQSFTLLQFFPSLVHPAAVLPPHSFILLQYFPLTRTPCCSSFLHSFTLLQFFPSLVHPAAVLSFTRSASCSTFLHSFTLLQYFPSLVHPAAVLSPHSFILLQYFALTRSSRYSTFPSLVHPAAVLSPHSFILLQYFPPHSFTLLQFFPLTRSPCCSSLPSLVHPSHPERDQMMTTETPSLDNGNGIPNRNEAN